MGEIFSSSKSFASVCERVISKWLLDVDDSSTTIAFASRVPKEGVSTIVAGMARSIAIGNPESVLVVDASPNRKRVSDLLHIETKIVAYEDLENWGADLSSFIVRNTKYNIDVLTLKRIENSSFTSAQNTKSLLGRLSSKYRIVLVDVGADTSAAGVQWLANSSYRILVIDTSQATPEIMQRHCKELKHLKIAVDGIILNRRIFPIPRMLYWLAH